MRGWVGWDLDLTPSSDGEVQHRAVGQDLEVGSTEECDRIARTSLDAGFLPDVPTTLPSRLRELAVLGPLLSSVSVVQRSHSSCVGLLVRPPFGGLAID